MKPLSMDPVEASVYENCAFEPDDAQHVKRKVSGCLFLSLLGYPTYRVTLKKKVPVKYYHVTGLQTDSKRKHYDL